MVGGKIRNYYLPEDVVTLIVRMSEQLDISRSSLVRKMTYHYAKCGLSEEQAKTKEGNRLLKKLQETLSHG